MLKFQKILAFIFILFNFFFLLVQPALAALVPCGRSGTGRCTPCDLWRLAHNIFNFLVFHVSIPVAILLFLFAGILFLTSGGSDERVSKAKSIFINVIIGLVIVFCAWLIVDTIIKTIAVRFDTVVWAWNSFPTCRGSGGAH